MKSFKIRTNLAFGILAILVSVAVWFLIPNQIPLSPITKEHINGRFIPKLMCLIMFICGLICLVRSLVFKDDDIKEIELNIELKNVIYLGMVLAYGLFARYVSFLLGSILFGSASLLFMRSKNWKKYLIVTAVIIAAVLIFKYSLKVRFGGLWGI